METTNMKSMNRKRLAEIREMFDNSCADDPHWGMIEELFEFAESQQPIPVAERLPEDGEFVLAWWPHNALRDGGFWAESTQKLRGRKHKRIEWTNFSMYVMFAKHGREIAKEPTHWLPLPPKP